MFVKFLYVKNWLNKDFMLIDTHCHLNLLIKNEFDVPLTQQDCSKAELFIRDASEHSVNTILTIGTNLIESMNCVLLAKAYNSVYAVVGIHPNDATQDWKKENFELENLIKNKENNKIVAIGECGLDKHYPDYNLQRQKDVFKAQIELALEYNLALVIHTRDAQDEVLRCLDEYRNNNLRGTIHCFSETVTFAQDAIGMGFVLGIGGTITYPKNNVLREVVKAVPLTSLILETDAPFLPPQAFRGKQNKPAYIKIIAEYLAMLRDTSFDEVAAITTQTAQKLFGLPL